MQRYPSERGVEYHYALGQLLGVQGARTVLDIGPGKSPWPALLATSGYQVTAIDNTTDYWGKGGFVNYHWAIESQDVTRPTLRERFDAVTCISTLEHIADHRAAVRGMFSMLRPGGSLIITVPWHEAQYHPDAYARIDHTADYICQIYSRQQREQWLAESNARLLDQRFYRAFTGDTWAAGDRVDPPREVAVSDTHQLSCLTLTV